MTREDTVDTVWYENRPLEVHKLSEMMRIISVGAELSLSQIYTNHSVKASAINLLSDVNGVSENCPLDGGV